MNQRIKFTTDCKVVDEAGRVVFEVEAGKTAVLPRASAERWIRRGKAVACPDEPPKAPAKKAAKKKAAKK